MAETFLNIKKENFHNLSFGGRFLLFDINRVKIFKSNKIEEDILKQHNSHSFDYSKLIEKHGKESVNKAIERLNRLSKISDSLAGYDGFSDYYSKNTTYNLWLDISHSCNLNCTYCYARDGGYEKGSAFMTYEVAKAGIDFFIKALIQNRQGNIVFAGREPLLNFKAIRNTVSYATKQQIQKGILFSFKILTNGTVMNKEILKFLFENNIWLQISLDGPEEIHNIHRKDKEGEGSFNKVQETIAFLKRNNFDQFNIRSTVCHQCVDVEKIKNFFDSKGYQYYYLRPVMSEPKSPLKLHDDDVKRLVAFYHEHSEKVIDDIKKGVRKTLPEDFSLYFEKLKMGMKAKRYCGAGKELIIMVPTGEFYPCPSLTSIPKFRCGSLKEGLNEQMKMMFEGLSVDKKEDCRKCWARNLCGGGCIATAYDINKDLSLPDPAQCEIIKAKISGAINVYDQIMH